MTSNCVAHNLDIAKTFFMCNKMPLRNRNMRDTRKDAQFRDKYWGLDVSKFVLWTLC